MFEASLARDNTMTTGIPPRTFTGVAPVSGLGRCGFPGILLLLGACCLLTSDGLRAAALPTGYPDTPRRKISLNQGWRFHLGDVAGAAADRFDDASWEWVHVPHTLKLTSLALDGCQDDKTQPTFHRDVGWYRRHFHLEQVGRRKVFVEFEGVHQVTDVWVNGRHAGQHAVGGYTPFHFDISGLVRAGENVIAVRADNTRREDVPPDPGPFDYVKFGGLYRDVYLVETDPVHITFNWEALDAGVFITTPVVDPVNMNAVIDFKTVVRNERDEGKSVTVANRVIDEAGLVVLKQVETQMITSGQEAVFKQIGAIEDELRLWSIDDPYLYRVNTLVVVDGEPVDSVENRLGIRKFEQDPVRGFLLNHEPIELIGLNRHQHYGYIGDALPDSLHYKDMWQFKQLGLNMVRTAHYPQDNALLAACDELGILVYEEAPTWISIPQDPKWFENYERALRTTIRNHRNHPSVVIWGAGINHRGYVPQAVLAAKQEDPTRLTASQSSRWTGWQTSGLADIFANMMYGDGIWDRSEPLLAMEGWSGAAALSSYVVDPLKTGMIAWTAHAYYTFHPDNLSQAGHDRTRLGVMTVFREPKRGLGWFPSELSDEPYLRIEDQWKQGVDELVVYSNAEKVELVVNGRPFMTQKPSSAEKYVGLKHPPFEFEIESFEAGTLEARGITGGKVIATQSIRTPGSARRIQLVADIEGRGFEADGADILVVYAHVVDENGTILQDANHDIHFTASGPASVVGDGALIGANPCRTRNGVSPALIRAGTEPGTITIVAEAEGLSADSVTVESIAGVTDIIAAEARPIYDFERIRVDIGAPDQLVQFDWTAWNGLDNQPSEQRFDAFGGITVSLKPGSEGSVVRWLGEMNVIGKYGFAYGEGVVAVDAEGLVLEFADLPAGVYRMKTWHHAPRSNTDSMDPNREKLRSVTIHKLPFARELVIGISDAGSNGEPFRTPVTEGKEMQFKPAAVAEFFLRSDGVHPVRITVSNPEGPQGIWLNAFELSQWHEDLMR